VLRTKCKFSECVVPLHKREGPLVKTFWRRFYRNCVCKWNGKKQRNEKKIRIFCCDGHLASEGMCHNVEIIFLQITIRGNGVYPGCARCAAHKPTPCQTVHDV